MRYWSNFYFVTKVQFFHSYQNLHFWNIDQILFCYKSSFCSPILKISIFKYSFITKVHFVHPYWSFLSSNIHLLQRFNMFTHIKTCIFEVLIKFYFGTKVHSVHPYWSIQFSNIHLLQKFKFFTHINFFFNIGQISILLKKIFFSLAFKVAFLKFDNLLQKLNLFTQCEISFFLI